MPKKKNFKNNTTTMFNQVRICLYPLSFVVHPNKLFEIPFAYRIKIDRLK